MDRFKKWKSEQDLWNVFFDAGGTIKKDGKNRYGNDDWILELGDDYGQVQGHNTIPEDEYDSDMGTILDAENGYVSYEKGKTELNSDFEHEIRSMLKKGNWMKSALKNY